MAKIRLDDMSIEDVRKLYEPMFQDLLEQNLLDSVYQEYQQKYEEMLDAEAKGYSAPSAMGRRYMYLKNMLYGWYIEDLFFEVIKKNPNVLKVEQTGNDSEHLFIYDHDKKKVTIAGSKTTIPDFLITMNNGKQVYLELKTAAAEVYSIKIGNVKQLQKTMGSTNIYSMIIMIDLVHGLYEIKDMEFFMNSFPFVNQRMEGQLCYDFPIPTKDFSQLISEDFGNYINEEMFDIDEVKRYKCLHIAEEIGNKGSIKKIKNKIALDEKISEFKFTEEEFKKQMNNIIAKSPDIESKTWDDILADLNN